MIKEQKVEITDVKPALQQHNVSRRLSCKQEEARLVMYEEAAQHLEMSVCDNNYEKEAAKIIAKQIRALAAKFERSLNGG